jgi:sugar O-acyltransferase (sialic acid O-acetyltransferase NeuD family)
MHKIIAPTLSPNDEQIKITKIYFDQNVFVKKNNILFELESSKISTELESEGDGYFYAYKKEGENVDCGAVIGVVSKEKINETKKNFFNNVSITKKASELINKNEINPKIFNDIAIITEADVTKYLQNKSKKKITKKFNSDDFIIVGAGSHGKVVYNAIISNSLKVGCFIDYFSNCISKKLYGIPIFNLEDIETLRENGAKKIYINTNDINLTKKIYNKCKDLDFEFPAIVDKSARLSENVKLNDCSFVGPNVVLGPDVIIGKFTKILNSSSVAHDTVIGDYSQISDGSTIAGNVKIGNKCMIGIRVGIINKVVIKNNVTVTSGNTVIKNLEDDEIIKISK